MKQSASRKVLFYGAFVFLVCAVALLFLPEKVPLHWNMEGKPDNYGSKYFYLFFGSLGLLSYFLLGFVYRIDPYQEKIEKRLDTYLAIRNIISAFLSSLALLSIFAVWYQNMDFPRMLTIVIGVFLMVLGNYLPRMPHNYFSGVKTPWALNDEHNWRKTQRFGGYGFVLSGGIMVISGILGMMWLMAVALSCLGLTALASYVYSWYLYNRNQH